MRICAFARCGNSSYMLNRWLAQLCKLHKCRRDGEECEECSCEVPFKLFPFPLRDEIHMLGRYGQGRSIGKGKMERIGLLLHTPGFAPYTSWMESQHPRIPTRLSTWATLHPRLYAPESHQPLELKSPVLSPNNPERQNLRQR